MINENIEPYELYNIFNNQNNTLSREAFRLSDMSVRGNLTWLDFINPNSTKQYFIGAGFGSWNNGIIDSAFSSFLKLIYDYYFYIFIYFNEYFVFYMGRC